MGKKRKTKKDKVILRLKRELARQGKGESYSLSPAQPPKNAPKVKKEHNIKISDDIKKYQFVKKDLTRSLALAILIMALEFFIYWRWG